MTDDTRIARRVAALLPADLRPRYREQWAADLRDAAELGLDRDQLVCAAIRVAVAIRARHVLVHGWRSALPWSALASGALTWCLLSTATIAVGASEDDTAPIAALLVLFGALGALTVLQRRVAACATLGAGMLLAAEGLAVAWVGHEGVLEVMAAAPLLAGGLVGVCRTPSGPAASRRLRAAAVVLAGVGGTLLLAGAAGIGGEYLDSLGHRGFDCLEGFAGDPSQYPDAPGIPSAITTGFGWYPVGRTCSWVGGLEAASAGRTTVDSVNRQTTVGTSNAIYGSAGVGCALLAAAGATAGVGRWRRGSRS